MERSLSAVVACILTVRMRARIAPDCADGCVLVQGNAGESGIDGCRVVLRIRACRLQMAECDMHSANDRADAG